jgi:putative membrane protein
VVGGGSAEAPLAYLAEGEAQRLRAELLARAAGLSAHTAEAPERMLVRVPPLRLLMSGVLTVPMLLGLFGLLVGAVALLAGRVGAVGLLVPATLSVLGPLYTSFVRYFEFTVAESPDGLRLRYGLLEHRSQTVPPGRVQAVRLTRPWLWRITTGWGRLEVNVAGYGGESGQAVTGAVLLPVAPIAEARLVLSRALPGVDVERVPLTPVPARARRLDPLTWRRLAAGADERVFVARRGRFRQELDVVPHDKTQSVRWSQGPLQRRLGLASVALDSTPGPVRPVAAHRDAVEAAELVAAQAARARAARSAAAPETWMSGGVVT